MIASTILSLAILKVNWDVRKTGYLENFIPLIAECLRLMPSDIITVNDLQKEMKSRFGLVLPQKTLGTLLRRAKRHSYVKLQDYAYIRNTETLAKLNFAAIQQRVLDKHDSLIRELLKFCEQRFHLRWNESEAEAAFQSYLQDSQFVVAGGRVPDTLIPSVRPPTPNTKYYIASFIQYLQDTNDPGLDYLDTVAKGNMLANAVFLADPDQPARKFKKTAVFFDSQFLIYALGYAGQPREAPCTELLELLYETGAELRCFTHTVTEMRGILDSVAHIVESDQNAYGPAIGTVEYFLSKGYKSSDIELSKVSLERDLQRLRINIVDKPGYQDHELVIDEKRLDEALKEIGFTREPARQRDVDSVSAIIRLRHGKEYYHLEECRAVFTTTNSDLSRVCNTQLCSSADCVPPCLTDYSLTNFLWLKKPTVAPDLPRKRIIADCYAAMQPDEKLWQRYLQETQKLKEDNKVSTEEYYMLRYSLEARQALMELTRGDDVALTETTIPEILGFMREKMQKDLKEKVRSIEAEKQMLQQEVEHQKQLRVEVQRHSELEKIERDKRIAARAGLVAKITARASCGFIYAALVVSAFFTFPLGLPVTLGLAWRYMLFGVFVIGFFWTIQNQYRGTTVKSLMRAMELRLSKRLVKLIRRLSD